MLTVGFYGIGLSESDVTGYTVLVTIYWKVVNIFTIILERGKKIIKRHFLQTLEM